MRAIHGIPAITDAFARAQAQQRPALITYLTLGYPDAAASLALVPALERAGADIIELGVPFSDPIADGPVIQAASFSALQNGCTPAGCFALAAALRDEGVQVPLLMMGYYNPILAFGPRAYVQVCVEAGVDGLIVPDLPLEESAELAASCREYNRALIYLVAPNTPLGRVQRLAEATSGFLYVVSRLGTTGTGTSTDEPVSGRLAQVRALARTPVAVGFGISNPAQARALIGQADGVIVGSAIVERAPQGAAVVVDFVSALRQALETADSVAM